MPVTIKPSTHGAEAYDAGRGRDAVLDAKELLWNSLPGKIPLDIELYQSSWGRGAAALPGTIVPSSNGLVDALRLAYSRHHHLVLRPEDLWFAILTQFSLYVNAHGEELRRHFVQHEGKMTLRLEYNPFSMDSFDFGSFAGDMGRLLGMSVTDPGLRDWIMPSFSTTNDNDRVVASIIMMGTLQKYFDYVCGVICGFPSVTLLGEKTDYEAILRRVDKLEEYGEEPSNFARLLRPVVRRFIRSFESPGAEDVLHFWRTAFDLDDRVCGITTYTGWITAFCFWDEDGKCLYQPPREMPDWGTSETRLGEVFGMDMGGMDIDGLAEDMGSHDPHAIRELSLDGVRYHGVDATNVPPAYGKVPVQVEADGGKETEMFAGLIGISLSSHHSQANASGLPEIPPGPAEAGVGGTPLDSMAPIAAWWITDAMDAKIKALKEKEDEELMRYIEGLQEAPSP